MINAFWPWLQDLASNRDQRPDEWARVIEYFYRLPPIGRSRSYIEKLLLLMADPSLRRSFEDDKQIRLRQNSLSDVALSSLMFSASPKPDDIRHEQSPSQPLANENEGVAKREKQKRGPSEKVVNAEMAKIAKQLKPLKVAMMTADQWQVALERVGISTSIRTIDRTEVYKEAKEKSHRFRDRSSVKAERAGDLVHQLADEEVQTTKRRSPKSSRRLA